MSRHLSRLAKLEGRRRKAEALEDGRWIRERIDALEGLTYGELHARELEALSAPASDIDAQATLFLVQIVRAYCTGAREHEPAYPAATSLRAAWRQDTREAAGEGIDAEIAREQLAALQAGNAAALEAAIRRELEADAARIVAGRTRQDER